MLHVKGNPLIPISIQHADGTIVEIGHNVPWSSLGFPHLDIPYVVDIRDIDEFAEYDTPEQCKVVYNMLVDKHWG